MMRSWLIMGVAAMVVLSFVTFGVAVSSTAPDHNANLKAPKSGVTNLQVDDEEGDLSSSEDKGDKSEARSRGDKRDSAKERRRSRESLEEAEDEEEEF